MYEYDKSLTFLFTKEKQLETPYVAYFETDEEAKEYAIQTIKSEGFEDYEVLVENIHREPPGFFPGIELYEIRIVK